MLNLYRDNHIVAPKRNCSHSHNKPNTGRALNRSSYLIALWFLVVLSSGCNSEPPNTAPPRVITASPEDIEFVKSQGWLEELMGQYIGGGIPCPRNDIDLKKCIRVDAALLPPIDPNKRDHFGQHYDPVKYYECRQTHTSRNDAECWKFRYRRNEYDPVWPYPDVPPIQWPEAPEDSGYRWWMSSESYFEHLCEAEAGKFVYRRVRNVESVYQIRPRREAGDGALKDRYIIEDPYHQTDGEARLPGGAFVGPTLYKFIETSMIEPHLDDWELDKVHSSMLDKPKPGDKYIRYFGYDHKTRRTMQKTFVKKLESRYGYVWRGIKRPHDRKNGIAGGELAVVDLKTNEILGLWRGFLRSGARSKGKVLWLPAQPCPKIPGPYSSEIYKFVSRVLIPKRIKDEAVDND